MYNMPIGVFVRSVEEGSPAQTAGVLAGDIIVEMDGNSIDTYEDLQGVLQYFAPGSSTTIMVMRQMDGAYSEVELNITFGERP